MAWPATMPETKAPRQESQIFYSLSIPTSGIRDFIGQTSFLGFGVEGTYNFRNTAFGLGFSASWIYFSDVDPSISKSIDAYPLYLRLRYMDKPDQGILKPYAALGFGVIYGQQLLETVFQSANNVGWQLAIAPELGLRWRPPNQITAFALSAKYDAGFGTDELSAISFLRFNVGVSYFF